MSKFVIIALITYHVSIYFKESRTIIALWCKCQLTTCQKFVNYLNMKRMSTGNLTRMEFSGYYCLTLTYLTCFEDVHCQSGVNHIYEGSNNCVSKQVTYHCKEECLSFIQKQTEIQLYKLYASYAHEVDVKNWICYRAKRNKILGSARLGF